MILSLKISAITQMQYFWLFQRYWQLPSGEHVLYLSKRSCLEYVGAGTNGDLVISLQQLLLPQSMLKKLRSWIFNHLSEWTLNRHGVTMWQTLGIDWNDPRPLAKFILCICTDSTHLQSEILYYFFPKKFADVKSSAIHFKWIFQSKYSYMTFVLPAVILSLYKVLL